MEIKETRFPGLLILRRPVRRDDRGSFQELFQRDALAEAGISLDWKQDNLSVSRQNVIRGLHYQVTRPQAKLIHVVHGAVFDVALDIRRSSPTFGQCLTFELKAGDGVSVLIPVGFAHGFAALEPQTAFLYKVSDSFCAEGDRVILWNDPELGIPWPIPEQDAILSEKDRHGILFKMADLFP